MKNKNIWIGLVMVSGLLLGSSLAEAAAGWETNLLISAGAAESRLSFGQRADATKQLDGRYDVPSIPGGTLQATFTGGGGQLWRDIRALGRNQEEWQLAIANGGDQPVEITWDAAGLPPGFRFELIDTAAGRAIDMESFAAYTVVDPAVVLTVRVTSEGQGGVK
jgi:hypothetical protein